MVKNISFILRAGDNFNSTDSVAGDTFRNYYHNSSFRYGADGSVEAYAILEEVNYFTCAQTNRSDLCPASAAEYSSSGVTAPNGFVTSTVGFAGPQWTVSEVPEPSIIALFGLGLAGIRFARRRQT